MHLHMLFLCYAVFANKCFKNFEIFLTILHSVTMPLCLHKYPFNEPALANVFVESVEYSNIDRYVVLLQL